MRDRDDLLRSTPIKGSNQTKVRGYNERLVLHLIRTYGALTKAEATRATGLSPNAVSMIFRALEADGLLLRDDPIRGRVGQPSVPIRLNPAARHYLGFKIGRRSFDLAVVDFAGRMVARRTASHAYPTPATARGFLHANLRPLLRSAKLKAAQIDGTGIAMPSELWHWTGEFGAPRAEMEAWRGFDVEAELSPLLPGPVAVENDGTAACRAELVFGPVSRWHDVIYFFVGTFIGGGIMLNGSVYPGRSGNSGGFGPLRIPDEPGGTRLVDHASLAVLERLVAADGRDPALPQGEDWSALEPVLSDWIARAARSLAHAVVSTLSVIDFEAVVIDGALPGDVRDRLVRAVGAELDLLDLQGVGRPDLGPGHLGDAARVLGAAAYRISTDCMIDQNTPW
ncbi:ROK family transcriptional regulator [Rhodovulum sp. 12E13]|uniref:ROK family transcriptional regulator n=1 Tax=Rhodovulum sp. 12E13 TaxID=2203891 RepID=UPI001F419234|nr:ROK family transcriptional regulator [Rhodovulum sp. 12E13]